MSFLAGCVKIGEGSSWLRDGYAAFLEDTKKAKSGKIGPELETALDEIRAKYTSVVKKSCSWMRSGVEEISKTAKEKSFFNATDSGLANSIELVKAAGEDAISFDLLQEIVKPYKGNGLAIDALIAASKNELTKQYLQTQKFNIDELIQDAEKGLSSIEYFPTDDILSFGKVSTLTKRVALIDNTCASNADAISNKYFELRSLYANRYL